MTTANPAAPAAATSPTAPSASIPWGGTLANILAVLDKLADIATTNLFNTYVPSVARLFISSSLVTQAIDYGFGAAEGAVKGQTLTIPVASTVAQQALAFLSSIEPTFASQIVAPAENLIIAELAKLGALPAGSTAASLGLPAIA